MCAYSGVTLSCLEGAMLTGVALLLAPAGFRPKSDDPQFIISIVYMRANFIPYVMKYELNNWNDNLLKEKELLISISQRRKILH
jgi:hypothetical protein